jgi:hypothetical protein
MYQCFRSVRYVLDLPDPHPDPLVGGTDPHLNPYQKVMDLQHCFKFIIFHLFHEGAEFQGLGDESPTHGPEMGLGLTGQGQVVPGHQRVAI